MKIRRDTRDGRHRRMSTELDEMLLQRKQPYTAIPLYPPSSRRSFDPRSLLIANCRKQNCNTFMSTSGLPDTFTTQPGGPNRQKTMHREVQGNHAHDLGPRRCRETLHFRQYCSCVSRTLVIDHPAKYGRRRRLGYAYAQTNALVVMHARTSEHKHAFTLSPSFR